MRGLYACANCASIKKDKFKIRQLDVFATLIVVVGLLIVLQCTNWSYGSEIVRHGNILDSRTYSPIHAQGIKENILQATSSVIKEICGL